MRALHAALAVAALVLTLLVTSFSLGFAATVALSSADITQKTRTYGSALTCTLTAVADTYVRKDQAGTSFGTATTLDVSNSTSATRRALVRFDLTGCSPTIPSDAIVHDATVRLTTTTLATTATRSYELRRTTSAWTESTTWTGQPTVAAAASATVSIPILTGAGTTFQWAAAPDVQAFIGGSLSNLGWRLADTAEDGAIVATSISFGSREAASNRPTLVITYRP